MRQPSCITYLTQKGSQLNTSEEFRLYCNKQTRNNENTREEQKYKEYNAKRQSMYIIQCSFEAMKR